jgi:hypothetical protein
MKIIVGSKSSLIIKREEGTQYESLIQHISSTEPQPYYGINFLESKAIGGRTMTEGQVALLIAAAKKAGSQIEE